MEIAQEVSRRIRFTTPGKEFEATSDLPSRNLRVKLKLHPDLRRASLQKMVENVEVSLSNVRELKGEYAVKTRPLSINGGSKSKKPKLSAKSGKKTTKLGMRSKPTSVANKFAVTETSVSLPGAGGPDDKGIITKVSEEMGTEPRVRFIDKVSFTLGVIIIILSEYLIIKRPDVFPDYYRILMSVLLLLRLVIYFRSKAQFFLIDMCYFTSISLGLQTLYSPDDDIWFRINYVLAMGPLAMAIPVYRNSLVFHSLDKMTSFFLHALPAVLVTLFRFGYVPEGAYVASRSHLDLMFLLPYLLFVYACWQVFYLLMTEVVFRQTLLNDPDLNNSLRHMTRDDKGLGMQAVAVFLRVCGILDKDEKLDPDMGKTKVVFVIVQFLFTFVSIAPTPWLFESLEYSLLYMTVIFLIGTWNGASFYIDVFSKTYVAQFMKKPSLWFMNLLFPQQKQSPKNQRKPHILPKIDASPSEPSMKLEDAITTLNLDKDLAIDLLNTIEVELQSANSASKNK